jgi:hypothetical protein
MSGTVRQSSSSLVTAPGHGFAAADPGAHTDGPDGHIVELGIVEAEDERRKKEHEKRGVGMDVDMVDGMDLEAEAARSMEVDSPLHSRTQEITSRERRRRIWMSCCVRYPIPSTSRCEKKRR